MGTYRYSAKFRADAVALVRSSDKPVAQIARDLGVNHEMLRQWVKAAERAEDLAAVSADVKDTEIARLRRQVRELEGAGNVVYAGGMCFAHGALRRGVAVVLRVSQVRLRQDDRSCWCAWPISQ